MNRFDFAKPTGVADALKALGPIVAGAPASQGLPVSRHPGLQPPKFVAGGTNLLDLMKENVMRPMKLVDINSLPLDRIEDAPNGGLMLGALARNADTAYNARVQDGYPLLAAAILAGASPQLRNMATNGGNLLQRTRCYYFYDAGVPCNKRMPGTGCPAKTGLNRIHAVLGASEHCIATHPSDMCVALAALDAVVHVTGPNGERRIPMAEFHRLPGDTPDIDTTLSADDLITGIELPANGFAKHSAYLKIRDRASYAFALVSVAAALELADDGTIRAARIAVGGVAHKPWRSIAAETALVGQRPSVAAFRRAAEALMAGAQGYEHNSFKIPLGRRAIVRALERAAGMTGGDDIPGSGPGTGSAGAGTGNGTGNGNGNGNSDDASIDRPEDLDFDDDSGRPDDGSKGLTPPVKPQLDETERQP
ncbi:MAG: putative xanthine dehydrogenase, binding subunit [Rhizobacter sp.]|nr:putative xanthine dehydrogenase, binding subunit [Rhizobacter sp.]